MNVNTLIYVILTVLLILIIFVFINYNKLVKLQNRVKKRKANIEIYLNKRFELVPNLVECVKSYSNYEKGTLENIVALRNDYNNKKHMSVNEAGKINSELTKYITIVESYPNLKADSQFMSLQNKLSHLEEELEQARILYNNDVTNYNIVIESIPSNIIASIFAFKKAQLFAIETEKRDNIKINSEEM